ncbi:MAG: hypothetical protein HZA90_17305 [Verrucomicrobia bacterium]|nr:hypothetical protein [Verrucomicrobiota bacterium]
MKASSFKNTLAFLALSGAIWLSPPMARSQAPAEKPASDSPPLEEPRIRLDIKQGDIKQGRSTAKPATVANVIENLRDQAIHADFVLSPGVAEIVVSNLTLRSADLRSALQAIGAATGDKLRVFPLGERNLYALNLGQAPRPEKSLEAFNLSPVLDSLGPRDSKAVAQQVEEITQFILATIKNFDQRTKQERGTPLVSFHAGTGLLLVIGHPEQLEIVSKIVQALNAPLRSGAPARTENVEATPKSKSTSDPRPMTP